MGFQKILVPLNESELDELAVLNATKLAAPEAEICLFSVVTPIVVELPVIEPRPVLSTINTPFGVQEAPKVTTLKTMPHPAQSRTRLTYLQGLATRLNQQGVNAYAEIQHGNVVDSIVGMAHDGFDVLVMATHGRKGLERVVFGSVAEAVLRRAPCPVLLLPTWLGS